MAAGAVIITAVLGGVIYLTRPLWRTAAPATLGPPRTAIAVAPPQNLSPDGPHGYFAGGLHDELLTQLAKTASLKVISRTSVMGYQGTTKPLKQIAGELGIGSVVEGSVQVVGGRLRVNVQLIDAATDQHLWADRYDRTIDDAFAVQSEIAQKIVAAVGAALSSQERGRIAAAHYFGRRDWRAALDEYTVALQGLPNDVQLREYIGYAHRRMGQWEEVFAAFEQTTRLDPRNATLFFDLGGDTFDFVRRHAEAVRAYDQALSLAPELHGAAVRRGWAVVRWQGNLDPLREFLDGIPHDGDLGAEGKVAAHRAALLLFEGNADGLLRLLQAERATVFEGQEFFLPTALYTAWACQLRGDRDAAKTAFEAARVRLESALRELPDDWRIHAARGLALAGLGRRDDARGEARWLRESAVYREDAFQGAILAEDLARILAQAGYADEALDEIERLLAAPSLLSVHTLRLDPRWDPIRNHPRFQALLKKYSP